MTGYKLLNTFITPSVELPEAPVGLGVSNIQARSVFLQFQPGFDGRTSITLWIVEALVGQVGATYESIYEVIYSAVTYMR